VKADESIKDAAIRELKEETNVDDPYLEQLYTFGDVERDPRGRVITVAYFALLNTEKITLKASTDTYDVAWYPLKRLPKLAFDHEEILNYALKRLRYKLEYTIVGLELLSEHFTLTELQKIYEIILDEKIDKRNFRKKIISMDFLEETKRFRTGSHRPAMLYKLGKHNAQSSLKKTRLEK
jgi:8-oxo-dGTP diphosphatase